MIWNHDTWILHPFLWLDYTYWTPMSNFKHPMQLSKALYKHLCLPKLFQQCFHSFQGTPVHFVDECHPTCRNSNDAQ